MSAGRIAVRTVQVVGPGETARAAARRMAETRVRRLAVVDRAGCLAGLLALDDVLGLLSEEFATVGRLLRGSG